MQHVISILYIVLVSFIIFSCSTQTSPVYLLTTSPNPAEAGSVSPAGGEYDVDTEMSITATPNEGWVFDSWQGDLSGFDNPHTLTIDSDKEITALFVRKTYPLTVTVEGEGTVKEEVVREKSTDYEHGTFVELTASPDDGWEFAGWGGAAESTEDTVQITVEEPTEVTALFEEKSMFYLAENGITIKCPDAEAGEKGFVDGVEYEAVDSELLVLRKNEDADLSKVCTSLVTNMSYLFEYNKSFNQPIGNWDVSNVDRMQGIFFGARSFNQPIGEWDVSQVTDMYRVFTEASSFNQPIGDWDVSNVTSMLSMFSAAASFNQPLEDWDVGNAIDMIGMFSGASSFNQPIGNWDVGSVTEMFDMFYGASSFNQDLTSWCVSNISSEPENFSEESALDEEHKPVWGTCQD